MARLVRQSRAVRVDFLGQPFHDADQIGTVITAALEAGGRESMWVATAWGKRSGLSRIANSLSMFREGGGRTEIVLGVDEGGATKEGLELALALYDKAYVFHDPGSRTFHPKIYVVEGVSAATAVVGSSNTTKGGLYTNYEAAVSIDLDLGREDDVAFLSSVRAYYDRLKALSDFCKQLSEAWIEKVNEGTRGHRALGAGRESPTQSAAQRARVTRVRHCPR